MPARLFVVHGSHPCNTAERALQIKHVPYTRVELPPPLHAPIQKLLFGRRTVPAVRFADGEKVSGSRAIVARLEELRPDPPLLPADPEARARVLEAEAWGDDVFQPVARRLLWPAMLRSPRSAASYLEGSRLPVPGRAFVAMIPVIGRIQAAVNHADDAAVAADLRALPAQLDHVDALLAAGVVGGERPNRADLQIAPTLALLMTLQDLRAVIAPRPCGQLADRMFAVSGSIPAGTLPSELVPAAT